MICFPLSVLVGLLLLLVTHFVTVSPMLLNPAEYQVLADIYHATNGPYWTYQRGVELDFAPWKITSNEEENPCSHAWYGLLCIGFDTYNGLGKLLIVNMTGIGNMTGRLPPVISNFTQLLYFVVADKENITGTVPYFDIMPNLQVLNLSSNALSGPIPDCWDSFQNLQFLSMANNKLTGEIPISIYALEAMEYISFFNNTLGGSISHLIANMVNLLSFNVGYNQIGGQLPTFIRTLGTLEQFLVENNRLTGPIPMQLPSALIAMQLSNNFFTGEIPASLCAAANLTLFAAANNRLTGRMPQCMGFFTELAILQLQGNRMTGGLRGIFDPYTSTNLWVLDITDNAFTGSFPPELFHLPGLISLAASKNCFMGSLPEAICNTSVSLQILALDGLQSSSHCALRPWDPLNLLQGYVTYSMEGSVPTCLWTLPELQVLHLAGNGLRGTLPEDVTLPASLLSVSLTHNEMSGTIPSTFLSHSFSRLDLSFNNFEGDVSLLSEMPFAYNSSAAGEGAQLSLRVNRLTGRLPDSLWHAYNVDVLNGNLFDCAKDRHDLPHHDPYAEEYFCGSTVFDNAAAMFGLAFLICVLPALLLLFGPEKVRSILVAPTEAMMLWLRAGHNKNTNSKNSKRKAGKKQIVSNWQEPVWMQKARLSCLFTLRYVLRVQVWADKTPEEIIDTYTVTDADLDKSTSKRTVANIDNSANNDKEDENEKEAAEVRDRLTRWSREQQMRRFGNFYRYVAALTLLRRLSLLVCLLSLFVCLPLYLLFYQLHPAVTTDHQQQFSTVQQRYTWVTTSAFLAGELPAGVLFSLWVLLLWLVVFCIARHYNLYLRRHQSHRNKHKKKKARHLVAVERLSLAVRESFSLFHGSPLPASSSSFSVAPVANNRSVAIYSPLAQQDVAVDILAATSQSATTNTDDTLNASQISTILDSSRNSAGSRSSLTSSSSSGSSAKSESVTPSKSVVTSTVASSALVNSKNGDNANDKTLKKDVSVNHEQRAPLVSVSLQAVKQVTWLSGAFLGIFLLNLSISIATNAAYLLLQNTSRLTTDAKTLLQLFMAAFKLVWNMVAVRILISKLPYSRRSAQLHVSLLLTNTVIAPCLAVAFTDSSCFSDFFFGATSVCTAYDLALCVETSQMLCTATNTFYTACVRYQTTEFVTEFTPSFIYYYGCAARLMTAYVPVYLYSYTILLLAVPLGYTILATLSRDTLPGCVLALLDGVLRPQDRARLRFRFLLRPTATQAMLTQHLIVLLTFGLHAPLLAVVMALAIATDTFAWQLLLARYLHFGDGDSPFSPQFLRPKVADNGPQVRTKKSLSLSKDDFPPDTDPEQGHRNGLKIAESSSSTLDVSHNTTTVNSTPNGGISRGQKPQMMMVPLQPPTTEPDQQKRSSFSASQSQTTNRKSSQWLPTMRDSTTVADDFFLLQQRRSLSSKPRSSFTSPNRGSISGQPFNHNHNNKNDNNGGSISSPMVMAVSDSKNGNSNSNNSSQRSSLLQRLSELSVEEGRESSILRDVANTTDNVVVPENSDLATNATNNTVEECWDEDVLALEEQERLSLQREQALEARLTELNTAIGRAWRGPRNTMWLVFYCALIFNAALLVDVAGSVAGWEGAMWLLWLTIIVLGATRLCFMEVLGLCLSAQRFCFRLGRTSSRNRLNKYKKTAWLANCCSFLFLCVTCGYSAGSTRDSKKGRKKRVKSVRAVQQQENNNRGSFSSHGSRGSGSILWGVFGDIWSSSHHLSTKPKKKKLLAQEDDTNDTANSNYNSHSMDHHVIEDIYDRDAENEDEDMDEDERISGIDELLSRSFQCWCCPVTDARQGCCSGVCQSSNNGRHHKRRGRYTNLQQQRDHQDDQDGVYYSEDNSCNDADHHADYMEAGDSEEDDEEGGVSAERRQVLLDAQHLLPATDTNTHAYRPCTNTASSSSAATIQISQKSAQNSYINNNNSSYNNSGHNNSRSMLFSLFSFASRRTHRSSHSSRNHSHSDSGSDYSSSDDDEEEMDSREGSLMQTEEEILRERERLEAQRDGFLSV